MKKIEKLILTATAGFALATGVLPTTAAAQTSQQTQQTYGIDVPPLPNAPWANDANYRRERQTEIDQAISRAEQRYHQAQQRVAQCDDRYAQARNRDLKGAADIFRGNNRGTVDQVLRGTVQTQRMQTTRRQHETCRATARTNFQQTASQAEQNLFRQLQQLDNKYHRMPQYKNWNGTVSYNGGNSLAVSGTAGTGVSSQIAQICETKTLQAVRRGVALPSSDPCHAYYREAIRPQR